MVLKYHIITFEFLHGQSAEEKIFDRYRAAEMCLFTEHVH